jgi:hypothetical protein
MKKGQFSGITCDLQLSVERFWVLLESNKIHLSKCFHMDWKWKLARRSFGIYSWVLGQLSVRHIWGYRIFRSIPSVYQSLDNDSWSLLFILAKIFVCLLSRKTGRTQIFCILKFIAFSVSIECWVGLHLLSCGCQFETQIAIAIENSH